MKIEIFVKYPKQYLYWSLAEFRSSSIEREGCELYLMYDDSHILNGNKCK